MGIMSTTVAMKDNNARRKIIPVKHGKLTKLKAKTTKDEMPFHEIKVRTKLPNPQDNVDPDTFLAQLVEAEFGYRPVVKPCLSLDSDFFPEVTEEQLAAYDMQVMAAARDNDVSALKAFYEQGQSMDCCNRFGETLLHLACRRGFKDMVDFLLHEDGPQLSVRIRDDCGRTPFHDACWNPQVQLDICSKLIERDPTLLLLTDKRGHTPFQYGRQNHWPTWRKFLLDNRTHLKALGSKTNMEIFKS